MSNFRPHTQNLRRKFAFSNNFEDANQPMRRLKAKSYNGHGRQCFILISFKMVKFGNPVDNAHAGNEKSFSSYDYPHPLLTVQPKNYFEF